MMTLRDLAANLPSRLQARAYGDVDAQITVVTHDSRQARPGALFVCLRGEKSDGHAYIPQAVEAGAAAIVLEQEPDPSLPIPAVRVTDARLALAHLAHEFYDRPSASFGLTGVTGTNGKTTVTYMIASIFETAGKKTGVIGTTGVKIGGVDVETHWSVSTTPEATELQALFAKMRDDAVDEVVMEASSHAIDQNRTACCEFDAAVFTNLTQDHLDYHKTMEAYRAAKSRLFQEYARSYAKKPYHVSINDDDETGRGLAMQAVEDGLDCWTYGISSASAVLTARDVQVSPSATTFVVAEKGGDRYPVELGIGGLFNVQNALAAIGATRSRGVTVESVQKGLATLPNVPGRFELVPTGDRGFHVLVDYAHTPDGLENVLRSARALNPSRLICVFGCGGNRDRGKRPIMGRLATQIADRVIVTSDNPRKEDPGFIIGEILSGISAEDRVSKTRVEPDRRLAIRMALREEARPGDLIVIAGKGHETYQLVGDRVLDFDDRKVAREEIGECD